MKVLMELISSKKAIASVSGVIVSVLVLKLGIGEDQAKEIAQAVVALTVAYVVGQGVADHGKSAAQIAAK